eukprot:Rhum_TRINITY_DN14332_c0_g1::Rhum_TRINITY_DN14332_c0_g1_i1::g.80534::m.80534
MDCGGTPPAGATPPIKYTRSTGQRTPHASDLEPSPLPPPPPPPAPQSPAEPDWRGRIVRLYRRWNPAKVAEVDAIMLRHRGHEPELYQAIVNKYATDAASTHGTEPPPSLASFEAADAYAATSVDEFDAAAEAEAALALRPPVQQSRAPPPPSSGGGASQFFLPDEGAGPVGRFARRQHPPTPPQAQTQAQRRASHQAAHSGGRAPSGSPQPVSATARRCRGPDVNRRPSRSRSRSAEPPKGAHINAAYAALKEKQLEEERCKERLHRRRQQPRRNLPPPPHAATTPPVANRRPRSPDDAAPSSGSVDRTRVQGRIHGDDDRWQEASPHEPAAAAQLTAWVPPPVSAAQQPAEAAAQPAAPPASGAEAQLSEVVRCMLQEQRTFFDILKEKTKPTEEVVRVVAEMQKSIDGERQRADNLERELLALREMWAYSVRRSPSCGTGASPSLEKYPSASATTPTYPSVGSPVRPASATSPTSPCEDGEGEGDGGVQSDDEVDQLEAALANLSSEIKQINRQGVGGGSVARAASRQAGSGAARTPTPQREAASPKSPFGGEGAGAPMSPPMFGKHGTLPGRVVLS